MLEDERGNCGDSPGECDFLELIGDNGSATSDDLLFKVGGKVCDSRTEDMSMGVFVMDPLGLVHAIEDSFAKFGVRVAGSGAGFSGWTSILSVCDNFDTVTDVARGRVRQEKETNGATIVS